MTYRRRLTYYKIQRRLEVFYAFPREATLNDILRQYPRIVLGLLHSVRYFRGNGGNVAVGSSKRDYTLEFEQFPVVDHAIAKENIQPSFFAGNVQCGKP